MSLIKIGTLLLASAVVACVFFVVIAIATPTPEPGAPFGGWQVLGTLLLIYWLGAAVAGAILLLVNLLNSRGNGLSLSDLWPRSQRNAGNHDDPARTDRPPGGGPVVNPSSRSDVVDSSPDPRAGSVRASVFCNKCGAQNSRGQRLCNSCENPLPV